MKLSPINVFNTNIFSRTRKVNPCCINFTAALNRDCFVKQQGKCNVKNISLHTFDGREISATISPTDKYQGKVSSYGNNAEAFVVNKDSQELAYIVLSDNPQKDCVIVHELYVNKINAQNIKGCGTELLKVAVQESIRRGYNGKVFVFAVNNPPPYIFYYKNNFRPLEDFDGKLTLILDFAAKHPNVPINLFLPKVTHMYMFLSEDSAKALLEDRHLYKQ